MIMGLFKDKQELSFYLFFFLISLAQSFGIGSSDNIVIIAITALSIIPFLIKVFSTKYTKKEYLLIIVLIIYAIISAVISKNMLFLINIFVLIALKNINIRKLIRIVFVYRLAGFLLVIILCKLGVFQNRELYLFEGAVNTYKIRESLGFYHPNLLGLYSFVLIAMFIYGFFHKLKIYHFIIMIAVTFVIYFICYSRTAMLCSFLIIFLSFVYKYFKKIRNFMLNEITVFFPILIILLFCIVCIFYNTDNALFSKINNIFSGRMTHAYRYIQEYGITLFGQPMKNIYSINGIITVIDSSYMHVLFNYGVIGFVLLISSLVVCPLYFLKKNMGLEFIIFCVFAFYCINENVYFVLLHFPLLYLSHILFMRKKVSENDS